MAELGTISAISVHAPCIPDFLKEVEKLASAIRKEEGCLRFDLLRDRMDPQQMKFLIYSLFKTQEEFDKIINQPYFKEYVLFTQSTCELEFVVGEGQTEKKQVSPVKDVQEMKADTVSIAEWAFQTEALGTESGAAFLHSIQVKPDRVNDFLKGIEDYVIKTRAEEGCLRFDLLQNKAAPGWFLRYENFKDDEAVKAHLETPHHKAWEEIEKTGLAALGPAQQRDGTVVEAPMLSISHLCSTPTSLPGGWAFHSA
jgi:autoinducer 2-degrading protein